ncbi:FAD-dependent oxidoreductase [Sphingobium sp.]|uniref:oxidoreductase n=1 Tax=Sphingobium sp. TaxID=1912891 RepID=UPI0028BE4DC6|nr:FAD-dependent oxidoreductase [Sphingobium sp.]
MIGNVELKNRVVRPAHATLHGRGYMTDDLIAYHERRAIGGVALSIIEVGSVHPTTPFSLNLFDPSIGDGYRKLVDVVKPHGMKLFQQLWHAGHNAHLFDGSPPWSASDLPGRFGNVAAIPMTKGMIDEIVGSFAECARRCEEYGLDGLDVQCGHGYLIAQFLSPITNKREDDYGGSFENRARFMIEVMEAVRSAVSKDMAVGIRISPDLLKGGLSPEEYLRATRMLIDRGLTDYVSLSFGNYHMFPPISAGMDSPMGYELPTSTQITRKLDIPTIVVGRFQTMDEADQVIRQGDADMVGMVRGLIADPDLVNKSLAGRADQVRPCIGCNQGCAAGALVAMRMECTVNAAVGRERVMGDHFLTPVESPKTVLIIGGGPSGMEAARVAALRGHKVILAEASSKLGGMVEVAKRSAGRHKLGDITEWLEREIFRLGVDVRLSTYVDAEDVAAFGADEIIVATGSLPRMDGVQVSHPQEPIRGMDQRHVISSYDLFMDCDLPDGGSAVVIDDAGHYEALACAEELVGKGFKTVLVTQLPGIGPQLHMGGIVEPALNRMYKAGDFSFHIRTRAIAIGENSVRVGPESFWYESGFGEFDIPADVVVFVSTNRSNRDIYVDLQERGFGPRIIGDALSPRYLQVAIRDGHSAGASI